MVRARRLHHPGFDTGWPTACLFVLATAIEKQRQTRVESRCFVSAFEILWCYENWRWKNQNFAK
jgi:hypothetical protein